jgi:hypothetical protein
MLFDWNTFVAALGLAFVIEGAAYFLGAEKMPAMLRLLAERPPSELRVFGGLALAVGLALVWLARS